MARGKAAAKNANRRARDAQSGADDLRQELRQLKESHRQEVHELQKELAAERAAARQRAGDMAQEAVAALKDSHAEQLRQFGISEGIELILLKQKDIFIMNACRYVSMKTGWAPGSALAVVITWCTNEDFYGFGDDPVEWVEKVGVSNGSWTASTIRRLNRMKYYEADATRRARRNGRPEAWSLDAAEERRDELEIHPNYKQKWYPRVRGWNRIQDWVIHDEAESVADDAEVSA